MSMNAIFVQVEDAEIARFEADPDSVEALFADQAFPAGGLENMTAAMQERLKAIGPQTIAATLSRLPEPDTNLLQLDVEADGFLYNMVRNIVGTLLEVGQGAQPASWVAEVLAARNRQRAGSTAPAQGLFLVNVQY